MYQLVNITPPNPEVSSLQELAADYARLSSALATAAGEVSAQINHVVAHNSGEAAEAFEASETSSSAIRANLEELTPAANRTSTAYATAAVVCVHTRSLLDTMDTFYDRLLRRAVVTAPANPLWATIVIQHALVSMGSVEKRAVTAIEKGFAQLDLPVAFEITRADKRGRIDPRIEDEFNQIAATDPQRAREILQAMADDYADANNTPRFTIEWEVLDSSGSSVTLGGYTNATGRLVLNSEILSGDLTDRGFPPSDLLNTTIHEMEHARQYEGMRDHDPSNPNRGNMTAEEGQRWQELNADYVRNKGYQPRPVEVGARDASRDYINNMTYEQFRDTYLS